MDRTSKKFSAIPQWHRHSATQLYWPSNRKIWPGKQLDQVEDIYCKIIEELHFFEPIHLFVASLEVRNRVMQKLAGRAVDLDRVLIHQQKIKDVWARRFAPLFVMEKDEYVILDWDYRNKDTVHAEVEIDPTLAKYISDKFGIKRVVPGITLEKGYFDANGAGILLATESILHNSNQYAQISKNGLEKTLIEYLGADQVIWLKSKLETDYEHVDGLTRWLNVDTVMTMISGDPEDVNYDILQENLEILRSVTLKGGRKLNIETLPISKIKTNDSTDTGLDYVTTNYTHFYVANGTVLVPLYNKSYDKVALDLFRKYFPGRKIIGIEGASLVLGEDSIYRITQPWYGKKLIQ
jgi:agmatine deiminase